MHTLKININIQKLLQKIRNVIKDNSQEDFKSTEQKYTNVIRPDSVFRTVLCMSFLRVWLFLKVCAVPRGPQTLIHP